MSKAKSNSRYLEVRDTVDGSTGEVTHSERMYTIRVTEEPFYMTFTDESAVLLKIERLKDVQVLFKLCELCEFNTGLVKFGTSEREAAALALGMSTANLSGSLTRLRRLGVVQGRGSRVSLNPRIYWKGTTKARREVLEKTKAGEAVTVSQPANP